MAPDEHAPDRSPSGDNVPAPRAKFAGGLRQRFYQADSYGLVLLLIVITYGIVVAFDNSTGASVVLVIQVATVWFALRTSRARRGVRLFADAVLALALVIAIVYPFLSTGEDTSLGVLVCSAILYFIAPLSILRHLVGRPQVDAETFLGAIAAYLLIGMFFAFTYRILAVQQGSPFFGSAGAGSGPQTLFFSFTTLTTTGYGNYVPSEDLGQSIAVLEMLIGQVFLATAIAKVITSWSPVRSRRAQSEGGEDQAG